MLIAVEENIKTSVREIMNMTSPDRLQYFKKKNLRHLLPKKSKQEMKMIQSKEQNFLIFI